MVQAVFALTLLTASRLPYSSGQTGIRTPQGGLALVVVLVLLVVIGLSSASALRSATSAEQAGNNIRLQYLAQQYAEAALRYCEAELLKPDGQRVASLRQANLPEVAVGASAAQSVWGQAASWGPAGAGTASKTRPPEAWFSSSLSAFSLPFGPECLAEQQLLPGEQRALVITARGFSPGYLADPLSGSTRAGAVVWLQSIVLLVDATDATEPSGAARRISDRLWQRIINPPIR